MQEINDQIYVLLVIATATEGSNMIIGDQHALLVFVSEKTIEKAQESAKEILKNSAWNLLDIKRASLLDPKLGISKKMEEAINDAAVYGSALIVYDKPIPKN